MPVSNQPRNREGQAAAERVLRDIEARNGPFVAAVQATRVPMVVTDPQITGNPIIYANDAFVRICGYERDDVLGQDYFFLLGEHASPEVAGRVEAAMAAGLNFIEDVPFRAKDGREVAQLGAGDFVGELSLLGDGTATATVTTATDAVVWVSTSAEFDGVLRSTLGTAIRAAAQDRRVA